MHVAVLQLQRAAASADLQLRAVAAFFWSVGSATNCFGGGMVPDVAPTVGEDVSEAFKVALTWVHVAVWCHAHVDEGCGAGLYA